MCGIRAAVISVCKAMPVAFAVASGSLGTVRIASLCVSAIARCLAIAIPTRVLIYSSTGNARAIAVPSVIDIVLLLVLLVLLLLLLIRLLLLLLFHYCHCYCYCYS